MTHSFLESGSSQTNEGLALRDEVEAATFKQEVSGSRELDMLCAIREACGRCRNTPKILHTRSAWRSVEEMGEMVNRIGQ